MAASPKYKVFTGSNGVYVASCKFAEDAAAVVALYQDGEIRTGHAKKDTVFRNGIDGDAGESVDLVAEIVHERENV